MTSSIIPDENEHLMTGWEPDVPADDTLVRQAVLAHASWPVEVARALGRPWRHTDRWAGGWVGDRGRIIAIDRFGASAPGETNMQKFGFTAERIAEAVREAVGQPAPA